MPDLVFLGQPGSVTGEDDKHLSTWCQRGLARLQHGWVLPVVEQQVTEDDHVKPPTFQTSQQRRGIRTPEIALSSQPNGIQCLVTHITRGLKEGVILPSHKPCHGWFPLTGFS